MDRVAGKEASVNLEVLREEISIQLELLDATIREINALQTDLGSRAPTDGRRRRECV